MPTVRVNGVELFYEVVGAGLPCLVLHGGLGADHTQYHPWLDPLGDTLRLAYYDQRCNGRSSCPSLESMTFDSLAGDVDALRDHLGVERIAVLGHSFGGDVALEYALRYPGRLSHLILVSATPNADYLDEVAAGIEQANPSPEVRAAMETPVEDDAAFGRMVEGMAPLYFHRYDPDLAHRFFGQTVWKLAALDRGDELAAARDLVPRLGEIATPTLILVGRHDLFTPPSRAALLQAGIPGSELILFEESGHLPYLEEPEAFFDAVRDWLRRTP